MPIFTNIKINATTIKTQTEQNICEVTKKRKAFF